jgi:hypothetical protein
VVLRANLGGGEVYISPELSSHFGLNGLAPMTPILNFSTIHIHKASRYLHDCIKRAAILAVQQPSESHGAASKEGCGL